MPSKASPQITHSSCSSSSFIGRLAFASKGFQDPGSFVRLGVDLAVKFGLAQLLKDLANQRAGGYAHVQQILAV